MKKMTYFMLIGFLIFSVSQLTAQSEQFFQKYHTSEEVQEFMKQIKLNNGSSVEIHTVATSPGEQPVTILEIGSQLEDAPAIFVGANFEGNIPLATEGALFLTQLLMDSSNYRQNLKWYILPQPNPDASADYFADLITGSPLNLFPINNDGDDATNEDGVEDLNDDGLITQMRVKDLEGKYIASKKDPRIMVLADAKKGERGEYKLYSEGIDNDKDGLYNEDGLGGINVGIAFPHLFSHQDKKSGIYAGQAPEVYGIMRFIYDRPEIAMAFTLGSSDFCIAPPKAGRKGDANLESIKIPGRYAKMFGVDASKKYSMDEVIEMMKERVPAGMEVTPSLVASILGLGAAVNPLEGDLKFYKTFSDEYKAILKKKNFVSEILPPTPAKDGSFELWTYYHLGVPSFSMNLFSVPKVSEKEEDESLTLVKVEKMNTDEFTALNEAQIDTFLKANNAPEQYNAKGVIKMVESGDITLKQMVAVLKKMPKTETTDELSDKDKALFAWSEKQWEGNGFVNWQEASHPDFGKVEVGGFIPYLASTPNEELISYYTQIQIPWLLELSTKLPQLDIAEEKVTKLSENVYKLEFFIENKGTISYPIEMGVRNNHPAPVIVTLDGDFEIIKGKKREPLGTIGGNQLKKLSWIIQAEKSFNVDVTLESAVFTDITKSFNLGGKK